MEFFWSIFCRVGTEYGETWTRKTPYSSTFHVLLQFSFVYEILVISFSFGSVFFSTVTILWPF